MRYRRAMWLAGGKRLLLTGESAGRPVRMWVRDAEAGPPRPLTPEGVASGRPSPDGKLVAAADMKTEKWALYPVDGNGDPRPIVGMHASEEVIGFDQTGLGLNVYTKGLKLRVDRLDLATGKRSLVREIAPSDPTGVTRISTLQMTPDGRAYCYSFMTALSRLYMVDGLH
jgi:hypothetical protein